ncbi:MAG: GNAT family N-acetyltransferase [Oceanicoccus sp.]
MTVQLCEVIEGDQYVLADLRVSAMRESLEALGRFDPDRARSRFLDRFLPADTQKIVIDDVVAGFYVVRITPSHLQLDHFYLHPDFQGNGVGGEVLARIKAQSAERQLPIRLGALRESRANDFYRKHGFVKTGEDEWDIYYQFSTNDLVKKTKGC